MGPSPMVDLRAQTRRIGSRERRQLSKRDARTRLRATLDPRGRTSGNASLERLLPPCAVATRLDLEPGRGCGDERKTDAVKLNFAAAAHERAEQAGDVALAVEPHPAAVVLNDEAIGLEPNFDASNVTELVLVDRVGHDRLREEPRRQHVRRLATGG